MPDEDRVELDIAQLLERLEEMNDLGDPDSSLYDRVPDLQDEWWAVEQEGKVGKDREQARNRLVAFIAKLRTRAEQLG